jgi:hypothetical protein
MAEEEVDIYGDYEFGLVIKTNQVEKTNYSCHLQGDDLEEIVHDVPAKKRSRSDTEETSDEKVIKRENEITFFTLFLIHDVISM